MLTPEAAARRRGRAVWPLALTRRARAIGPGLEVPVRPAPARHRHVVEPAARARCAGSAGRSRSARRSTSSSSRRSSRRPSDTLHETPFLYLAGDRAIELPSTAGIEALRRFLTFGGFLLIDSAEGSTDGAFDGSVRKLIAAIFPSPAKGLEVVPADHVVYKSFYLLDKPLGRLAIAPAMEGVIRDGRLVCAYVANDLGGAWARDDFGNYDFPCEPGGEKQRELVVPHGREPRDVRALPRLQVRPGPRAVHHEAAALEARRRREHARRRKR